MRGAIVVRTIAAAAVVGTVVGVWPARAHSQSAEPVDLRTWTRSEYDGTEAQPETTDRADWRVSADGTSVTQRVNVDGPSFFVSDFELSSGVFEGTFRQGNDGDDDYMGFVFGFQGLDVGYYLFQWKSVLQRVDWGPGYRTAEPGWSVLRVVGRAEVDAMEGYIWDAETGGPVTLLASDKGVSGNEKGWVQGRSYTFRLELEPGRARIAVSGTGTSIQAEIVDDTFMGGRVGFYNFSQSLVTYRGFTTVRPEFIRGDANADGAFDVSDAIAILDHLFRGGPAPECASVLDVDDSETINLNDPIFALNGLFGVGDPIPAPFPECGWDPTPGPLVCPGHGPCRR